MSGIELQSIQSLGADALTTPGLEAFKRLLETARRERHEIELRLGPARAEEASATSKYESWKRGILLRHIRPKRFAELKELAEHATAERAELDVQLKLAALRTEIEMPDAVGRAFDRLCDDFSVVARSQKIWDTVGHRAADKVAERTSASRVIDRQPVSFELSKSPLINLDMKVPHMENANGGDLYIYPGFVLYAVTADRFALLGHNEIVVTFSTVRFIERDPVPSDSHVVGQTWAKTNKDGSPDRRFKDNYEVPVVQYGQIKLASATGLQEEYQLSNVQAIQQLERSWAAFCQAIGTQ